MGVKATTLLGLVLILAGALIGSTGVGLVIGIPLIVIGIVLVVGRETIAAIWR